MTREEKEEAIEELEQMIKWGDPYEINADACKVAIKALEQEPCEDTISRHYLRKQFQEKCVGECSCCEWDSPYWCGLIDNAPPVNPQEPKTGYWIDADGNNAICSCCNRLNHFYGTYCKHCGAKMVEPQKKQCADCNHYGKLSLDCGRCDDNCSMFEPQESKEV